MTIGSTGGPSPGPDTSSGHGEHPWSHPGQLAALGIFLAVWGGDSFVLRATTFPAAAVPLAFRLLVLALALAAGFWLVTSGHVVVSRRAPPAGVVTTGAFRYVRHPIYLGTLLCYLGLALATASVAACGVLVAVAAFYNVLATYEETVLEARFGEDYRRYKQRTGKWLPRPGRS
jgi:protein-S-isoprenylcysteine O-methyltransferase Ste14